MTDNYTRIVQDNLARLYQDLPQGLGLNIGGVRQGDEFVFNAFGRECVLGPEKITLGGKEAEPVLGILISLYALSAHSDACIRRPFKAFKEFPDSMPYTGAFVTHTEQALVPHVEGIRSSLEKIADLLEGEISPKGGSGDFSFSVQPLPKISLYYIFYEADEDFPASAVCLYSSNARLFLPVDGLADLGEYTSKEIISIAGKNT